METTTVEKPKEVKRGLKQFPMATKKRAAARLKSGEKPTDLCKEYGVNNSTIYNWYEKVYGEGKSGTPSKNKKVATVAEKPENKVHDSEKELLRKAFADSLSERFRKSLEGKSAAALIEIGKALTEKGM